MGKISLTQDAIKRLYTACNDTLTFDDLDLQGQKNGKEFQKIDCIFCGGKGTCFTDPSKKQITCRAEQGCDRTDDYAEYYKHKWSIKPFEMFKSIVPALFDSEVEAAQYQGAKADSNFNTAPKQDTGQEEARLSDSNGIDAETAKLIKKNQYIARTYCKGHSGQIHFKGILNLFCNHRGIPEEYIKPYIGEKFLWKPGHLSPSGEKFDAVVVLFTSLPGIEHVSHQYFTYDNSIVPGLEEIDENGRKKGSKKTSSKAMGCGFFIVGSPLDAATTEKVFITESVINALTLLLYVDLKTICVIAIGSSSEARKKAEMLKPWLKNIKLVVSCGDNDKAGNSMDSTIARVLKDTVAVHVLGWRRDDE